MFMSWQWLTVSKSSSKSFILHARYAMKRNSVACLLSEAAVIFADLLHFSYRRDCFHCCGQRQLTLGKCVLLTR